MTAATAHATHGWDSADAWAALHRADTTAHDLAAIAAAHPDYAEQIAQHPQAYPALIEWAGIVAARRRAPDVIADAHAGGRRESGAHPLAFSADAAAWRAAVAAGSLSTQGNDPAAPGTARTDAATERIAWTPAVVSDSSADATVSTAELAAARAAAAAPRITAAEPLPWWVGVAPTADAVDVAAEATGARAAADRAAADRAAGTDRPAHTMHPATFSPVGAQRAAAIAVGSAAGAGAGAGEAARPALTRDRPTLPTRSAADAADAARATAGAHPATSIPTSTVEAAVNAKALLAFVFAFVFAPLGIVFGHLALRNVRTTGEPGRGYALAGLVIGYSVAALAVAAAASTALVLLFG